jgi:hypothetical protein
VLTGQRDGRLGPALRLGAVAAMQMQLGVQYQREDLHEGIAERPGQGLGLPAPLQGLIRVAEMPEGPAQVGVTENPGVQAVAEHVPVVFVGVVKCQYLLEMRARRRQIAEVEATGAERPVGRHQ